VKVDRHRIGTAVAEKNSRTEAVRSAVDQAFQSTAGDLAQAAGRVRDALDDLRPPTSEEIRGLRADLRALEERVAALEKKKRPASKKRSP
jgi:polyhydroxyalkanoate synthesis regulator phasin